MTSSIAYKVLSFLPGPHGKLKELILQISLGLLQ